MSVVQDKELQSLDRLVYGVVYWATRLKNEKCTMSNQTIAECLGASAGAVSNSLSRLDARKYLRVILDEKFQRTEIIPFVYMTHNLPSVDVPTPHELIEGVPSVDVQNKNINKNTHIYTEVLTRWNSHGIINHRELTRFMEGKINSKLEHYSLPEILATIDNYAKILGDQNCYFKYKWTLVDFLQRGFEKFFDYPTALANFRKKGAQDMEVVGSGFTNIKDYNKKYGTK